MKLSVEEISDEEAFFGMEKEWNEFLVRASTKSAPFLRHEWFRIWWKAFGRGRKMAILIVRTEGGKWLAAAPLMEEETVRSGVPCRVLTSMSNDHSCRFDLLLADEPPHLIQAAVDSVSDYIARRAPRVDLLELQDLHADSPTALYLHESAKRSGRKVGLRPTLQTPYIPIAGAWSPYLDSISGHLKRNLRRRRRQLEEQGKVSIQSFRGEGLSAPGELADRLREGFEIEAMAWKGSAGTAIREDRHCVEFYQELARTAAERGWLRLYFLRLNGRTIAFYYALLYDRKLYYLKLGYDPAYARYSPGILLHQEILESLFNEKAAELDFLGPSMAWKQDWAKEARPHVWFYIFQHGVRPQIIYFIKFKLLPFLRQFHRPAQIARKFFSKGIPAPSMPAGEG